MADAAEDVATDADGCKRSGSNTHHGSSSIGSRITGATTGGIIICGDG